jgi:hypothetical protein
MTQTVIYYGPYIKKDYTTWQPVLSATVGITAKSRLTALDIPGGEVVFIEVKDL